MLETLAEYSLAEILPLISTRRSKIFKVNGQDFLVKTCSRRLQVFQRSLICTICGVAGTVFRLQRQSERNESPHLNLYALKKEKDLWIGRFPKQNTSYWVLMTQDHILPKSKGGKDSLDNLCTMCTECNMKKGNNIV